MKAIAPLLSLLYYAAAKDVEVNVDWPSFLSRHDMKWDWEWAGKGREISRGLKSRKIGRSEGMRVLQGARRGSLLRWSRTLT